MDERTKPPVPPSPPAALPTHVKLLAPWGRHCPDKVLKADPDLIGALDVEGVKYREATTFERRIGGFVD